ncbi:hypothetical protein [Spirosoma knui]
MNSCLQDHRSNITPDGRRFQLKTMTTTGSATDSRTFSYNSANQLIGIQTSVARGSGFSINQINTYNDQGLPVLHKAVVLSGGGQDLGGRKVFEYNSEGKISRVTLYNIFPPPIYAYQEYIVYDDRIQYDTQGRVARVERDRYMQPVRGSNFKEGSAVITIEYDSQDNPVVVNSVSTLTSIPNRVIRSRAVYEYDDKPNVLSGIDFPSLREYAFYAPYLVANSYELAPFMKHNPLKISVYESKPLSNDLDDLVLTQTESAVYEYMDGLPTKATWTESGTYFPPGYVYTYTFDYNFY